MPKPNIQPNHVAILVPSVRQAAEFLKAFDFDIGPEEDFEGEGTREIYVGGGGFSNLLLLVQPTKAGPYQQALKKRGPGVHHMAIDVADLDVYLASLVGSGWLLHPMSVNTMKNSRTAYLARPGFGSLIEVQERKIGEARPLFVESLSIPIESSLQRLTQTIGLDQIVTSTIHQPKMVVNGKSILLSDLYRD